MAPFMSNLAAIIPFSSGISIIQQSVFYGVNIFELTGKIFSLVLILVVCIIILCIARKINQNRFKKGN
jgi:ABC-type polysaccharide/polyol phosphate export permease